MAEAVERTREVLQRFRDSFATRIEQLERAPAPSALLHDVYAELVVAAEELAEADTELQRRRDSIKSTEAALELERQQYRDLFDRAPDAYLITDHHGVIAEANRAATALLSTPRVYLLGKPLIAFVERADAATISAALARALDPGARRPATIQFRLRPRNRRGNVPVRAGMAVVGTASAPTLRWLLHDISEQLDAEATIARLSADLEQRVRERTAQLQAIMHVNASLLEHERAAREAAEQAVEARDQALEAVTRDMDEAVAGLRDVLALILDASNDDAALDPARLTWIGRQLEHVIDGLSDRATPTHAHDRVETLAVVPLSSAVGNA
jgi:PAS domain S-box-containing protein